MFFIFLNKDDTHYIDISTLRQYTPSQVIFYFYNSFIKISVETYLQAKELSKDEQLDSPLNCWIELLDNELEASTDLSILQNNEYLNMIGPYYYPRTATRFYFTKENISANEIITAEDLSTIIFLDNTPPLDKGLYSYQKGRKSIKKSVKNINELIKDIDMCIASLQEIEKLNKHLNYLNKFLEKRYTIVEQKELLPPEPDTIPEKPKKADQNQDSANNIVPLNVISRRRKQSEKISNNFNHEMKVYFIKYREYEKACERYKTVLINWDQLYQELMDNCFRDIDLAEEKLRNSHKYLKIYNTIIEKSYVHADYQDIKSLNIFKSYLETGRANDIQDCMNLFEEDKHWNEIKASQERIENTIYFLQNSDEGTRFASEHFDQLFKRVNKKPEQELEA